MSATLVASGPLPLPAIHRAGTGTAPHVLCVFPGFAVGGAQMRFASLVRHWGRRFRFTVVSLDGSDSCRAHLPEGSGVELRTVAPASGPLAAVARAHAALRGEAPDLLVTSNWGAMDWAAANLGRATPHVHTEDGFGPEERSVQLRRRVLARRALLRSSTVVLPSRTLLRLAQDSWRLDPARLRFIPNGIDLQRFAPADRAPSAVPVIGTVAGLRPEKNIARLLRAFRVVLDHIPARLCVVGSGPERAALETLAATLGIAHAASFAGPTERPDAVYAAFDIFALSSDTEQMPLSLMEAMACGLPAVATDVGDIRAMVSVPNRCFVVPPDHAALANGLLALLRDPARRRAVGEANRAKAAQAFGDAAVFEAYGALFDRAARTNLGRTA